MDGKGESHYFSVLMDEENIDCLYPMFFGVSCAFFALRLLPGPEICDDKWLQVRNRMFKGSAHLLGLFIWRVQREEARRGKSELLQKLKNAQNLIDELKERRSEEAKANEKVVSIIAAREQSWFDERKRFRHHIGDLMKEFRVVEMKKEKSISELKATQVTLQQKETMIEEVEHKRWEIEEKLKKAESIADELRENTKCEAQRHANEILKHKTAFIELVSNQRHLEAEMGRAVRQLDFTKQELDSVLEQKDQSVLMVQSLSMELVKMRKDLEQKDRILSVMLRKTRLDTSEKQMLLKELKSLKTKRKQAELEIARWKAFSEAKHDKHSLRNMLSKQVNMRSDLFLGKGVHFKATMSMDAGNFKPEKVNHHHDVREGIEEFSLMSDPCLTEATDEQKFLSNIEHLENWVDMGKEAYQLTIEQRHALEVDAFAEQMRLKDEQLDALRWHLLGMELESKRLQSHVDGLHNDITQLRQENMKLEASLLDCDEELQSLKEKLALQFNPPKFEEIIKNDTDWSKTKVVKRIPGKQRHEIKATLDKIPQVMENENVDETTQANELPKDRVEAEAVPCHFLQESSGSVDVMNAETSASVAQGLSKKNGSTLKMDIHALGVLYKIKRLKQQLLLLEKVAGKQESCENSGQKKGHFEATGFYTLASLLNKQVDRYQSLQGRTDDLCQRMHDSNLNLNRRGSTMARTAVEIKKLEKFLEETFQLQRYIVATGQKLMELQAKIASGFGADAGKIEKPENFDMKRFADSIRKLFQEVQREVEVQISRIIGDLEGTLACDGIIHIKK